MGGRIDDPGTGRGDNPLVKCYFLADRNGELHLRGSCRKALVQMILDRRKFLKLLGLVPVVGTLGALLPNKPQMWCSTYGGAVDSRPTIWHLNRTITTYHPDHIEEISYLPESAHSWDDAEVGVLTYNGAYHVGKLKDLQK